MKKRIQFEYEEIHTNSIQKLFTKKTITVLNEMGREGWEVIWIDKTHRVGFSALLSTNLHTEYVFYFKRKV